MQSPSLGKCPHCRTGFWIVDAKLLAKIQLVDRDARWDKAEPILEPSEADCLSAAGAPNLSRERELYARQRAWWLANDPVRGRTNEVVLWRAERRANLERLSSMFDTNSSLEVIYKAEIARELGQFDACRQLLARPFEEQDCNCAAYAGLVRDLADRRISRVERR